MKDEGLRPWLAVIAGGASLVSHAGATLLVETARRSGLTRELSARGPGGGKPLATHDPGKIMEDLAIAVALGWDAAADVAALPAQPAVFGPVASDPTVSRLIAALAQDAVGRAGGDQGARATARERVWSWAAAPTQNAPVVIDLDATLVIAHSDKEDASRTWSAE